MSAAFGGYLKMVSSYGYREPTQVHQARCMRLTPSTPKIFSEENRRVPRERVVM